MIKGSTYASLIDPLASMKIIKKKSRANSDLKTQETKKLFIYTHERLSQLKVELDEMTYQKNALQAIMFTVQECLK